MSDKPDTVDLLPVGESELDDHIRYLRDEIAWCETIGVSDKNYGEAQASLAALKVLLAEDLAELAAR